MIVTSECVHGSHFSICFSHSLKLWRRLTSVVKVTLLVSRPSGSRIETTLLHLSHASGCLEIRESAMHSGGGRVLQALQGLPEPS